MIIHETLAQLGVSERQTDLYLTLLKLGPSSIRDIAVAAGVNRGTTYEELKTLRTMSLVTYSPQGKRRFFCAEAPEVLLRIAQEKRHQIDSAVNTLELELLPDLKALTPESDTTAVFHYEGDEGIEYVLRDILDTVDRLNTKDYRVYSSRQIRKYLYRPFPGFTRARVSKGIHVNVIAIGEGGEDAPLSSRKWIASPENERVTPANKPGSSASYVAIYGTKCAFISLLKGDYPTAVILDSTAVAAALRISFDELWDRL